MRHIENRETLGILELNLKTRRDDIDCINATDEVNLIAPLIGSYQGEVNPSYLVDGTENAILQLAYWNNQESVLFVRPDKSCFLVYLNDIDNAIELGRFTSVDKITAEQSEGYTYAPHNDTYYVAQ